MIRLHVTQKLFAKLPLDSNGRLKSKRGLPYAANDAAESPLSGWHANLLTLQRRQCVLFVHDTTRFPVFVPALKKDDFAELDFWFTDGLMNTLLKMGADEAVMERAEGMLGPLLCDRETDRSVQGTLNSIGQELEHILRFQDAPLTELSPYRINLRLAQVPRKVKGSKEYLWPLDEMFRLLGSEAPEWTRKMV